MEIRAEIHAMRLVKDTAVALAALFALLPSGAVRAETSRTPDATGAYVEGLIRSLETKETEARHIGLAEAVVASVANNPGIIADRREPEATAYDVLGAEAVYEPKILIDFYYEDREIPTSDLLSGVDQPGEGAEPLEGDDYFADVTLTKLLRTGTRVDLSVDSTRRTTNSGFEALSPRFDPSLGIGIEQSLLRDFGGTRRARRSRSPRTPRCRAPPATKPNCPYSFSMSCARIGPTLSPKPSFARGSGPSISPASWPKKRKRE